MHIILGLLGVIVTILILLNRLSDGGIDIGWLNPFAWRRRRAWRRQLEANPVYTLDSPMEVTALLALAVAKSDGDMTAEQKTGLQELFVDEFNVDDRKAAALINSSAFLLRDGEEVRSNIQRIMQRSADDFSAERIESARVLLSKVAALDGPVSPLQQEILDGAESVWRGKGDPNATWN